MTAVALIGPADLAAGLGRCDWCVVDVRHRLADPEAGGRAYSEGHLPGALFLHIDHDLSGARNGSNGRHPLPDPAALAARLGACGIDRDTQVVAYDDMQGLFAARLWWLLRWLGHERVAVLDGGLQAWRAHGGILDTGETARPARNFVARPEQDRAVGAVDVLAAMHDRSRRLIDARSPDRFRGENETIDPVGGHIPGACNRFFADNLLADGTFKPAAQLHSEWLEILAGLAPQQAIHYCGSGISACHNLLALEQAGMAGGRLYPGSWSEWCADPERPRRR